MQFEFASVFSNYFCVSFQGEHHAIHFVLFSSHYKRLVMFSIGMGIVRGYKAHGRKMNGSVNAIRLMVIHVFFLLTICNIS